MDRINSFPPIADDHSKILILRIYAWCKISSDAAVLCFSTESVFGELCFIFLIRNFQKIMKRESIYLKRNKVALWDVIESCERKGSLDTEIKDEVDNDTPQLIENHPNIKIIFCNGQKSYKNLLKILGKSFKIPIVVLPSYKSASYG